MSQSAPHPSTVTAAIVAGCLISFITFGFSATFGVFLRPMSEELGWGREVFSLSMAVQLLFWGIALPVAGMLADRFGSARVLVIGAFVAALGFLLRGTVINPTVFVGSGVIVGLGTGAASFQIVIVALGKVVSAARRSLVLGLGTASASAGMFFAAQISSWMAVSIGWQAAILVIAASFLLIPPLAIFVARVSRPTVDAAGGNQFGYAIKTAFGDSAYVLLFFGFFVCGFHVAFIQNHLPAYITDAGMTPAIAAWSLSLIGLFNIAGALGAGWFGQRYSKKAVLASIYVARAIIITGFILVPLSAASVILFSAVMGVLWLSTVPLTTALVGQTQGLRFMSTLVGLVFLSHQIGSFLGAWLGGRIYDQTGSYTGMWWAAVLLGLLAALLHIPIREAPGKLAQREAAS